MKCDIEDMAENSVEINVSGSQSQSIKAAVAKVIASIDGPVISEDIVAETIGVLNFSDEEKLKRHDLKLEQDIRRVVGVLKSKGANRIIDAYNEEQGEFSLPLGESTLVTIDEDIVIPMERAKVEHVELHHGHHTAKRMAQIEEIRNAQRREESSVAYIKNKMSPDLEFADYDNGEGVAKL